MIRIKICGITNSEDARAAIDYGADALGFILVPESPRYIKNYPDTESILEEVPPFVTCVAVCRDTSSMAELRDTKFQAIQFYEASRPHSQPLQSIMGRIKTIRAFRIQDESSLSTIAEALAVYRPHAIHLDAYHPQKLGGAGVTFNWELAIEAKARFGLPIILAGGLTPDNVAEAIRIVQPYAVDVSSGVEAEPGRKDHARLRAFIGAVRRNCSG